MQVTSHAKPGRQAARNNRTAGAPQARLSQPFSIVQRKKSLGMVKKTIMFPCHQTSPFQGYPYNWWPAAACELPWESHLWLWSETETWTHTSQPSWKAAACAEDSHSLTGPPVTQGRKAENQKMEGLPFILVVTNTIHSPVRNMDGTSTAHLLARLISVV